MKKQLLLFACIIFHFTAFNQTEMEYYFDQARVKLAQRKLEPAIDLLRKIYVNQSDNANVNFLMGAAYTELPGLQKEAVFHLKKAVQNIKTDYVVGSFEETAAPIHVYYYLTIALVEEDLCAQAAKTYEQFKEHESQVNNYFIAELERHLQKCPYEEEDSQDEWKQEVAPPEDYDPLLLPEEESFEVDSAILANKGLVTQKLEYTTKAPLYGVQIGSNLNPSPTSNFSDVKNVDVFIDNEGIIRYVVGHFSYREQAESLLERLIEKGYQDAFVVNVNDERKYSNEVISYNNVNLRARIAGKINFYVQVGAFQDTIPESLLKAYFEIDEIQEVKNDDLTLLLAGEFETYQDAVNRKDKIQLDGFKDAFIVAYHKGKKIDLQEAIRSVE